MAICTELYALNSSTRTDDLRFRDPQQSDGSIFGTIFVEPGYFDRDIRETVLRLELPSLEVHCVRAAKYSAAVHSVRRHRTKK
jgi:hypothetical protein